MQDYNKSENYINRELSWLDLICVYYMKQGIKKIRCLKDLNFFAITSSNLDEFFMGMCCAT